MEFADKRKNFRFPAFDDKEGVKLPKSSGRDLFSDEFKTPFSENQTVADEPEASEARFQQEAAEPVMPEPYVPAKAEPLKREKRPDFSYQGPPMEESVVEVKKPVFYSDHRASLEKKLTREKKLDQRASSNAQPGKYKGRSYFVPKHIPASIVPEGVEPAYSKKEIIDRMKKPKASYLILEDNEDRSFQYDEIEKREISEFEVREEETTIPFTRREFKQMKKGSKNDETIPAITRKKKEQPDQTGKNTRLEKSLSGIMEEETSQSIANKYFD
ncbi:hypothetical protein [uncultured Vagococcus sp.]|uniref:hypothetical protein n=1 Tax=uncultured Vagococcus sp. TaxID=189676 RepID=UPI0028D0ADC0|nr:hypothetical protein [uncultured Vagococcus sp.]